MTTSHGLPGLFPVHDGSYGVNTLVNVEPLVRRGGRTRASGVADEDDEDRIFRRRVHGRDGRRFDMNQNGDSEIQSAVDAANQDHADPTNGAANGGQPEPPITQETGTNPPVDTPNIHPHYKSDKPDSQQIKPAIPSFGWAGFIKSPPGANPRTPPYTQTELPTTLNEYSYINNSHLPESGIPRSPPLRCPHRSRLVHAQFHIIASGHVSKFSCRKWYIWECFFKHTSRHREPGNASDQGRAVEIPIHGSPARSKTLGYEEGTVEPVCTSPTTSIPRSKRRAW